MNVENDQNNQKSSKLIERTKYKDTDIEIISNEDIAFATLGKFRISDKMQTVEEVLKKLDERDFNIIITLMVCIAEAAIKQLQIDKEESINVNQ